MLHKQACLLLLLLHQVLSLLPPQNEETKMTPGQIDKTKRQVEEKYIKQPVDHFNENDNATWAQKYLQRLDFFSPDGPILLHINDDELFCTDAAICLQSPFADDMFSMALAKEFNGAMIIMGRRYITDSQLPNGEIRSLKYHTPMQSVEDAARLVKALRSQTQFAKSKVIVLGVGEAGAHAVWFRQKYPDLVDMVYASGAPLLAKLKVPEYYEAIGEILIKTSGQKCYDKVVEIFNQFRDDFKTEEMRESLKEGYGICESTNLMNEESQYLFLSSYILSSRFLLDSKVCRYYVDHPFSNATGLGENLECHDFTMQFLINDINQHIAKKIAFYTKCFQFGHVFVSSKNQPFGYLDTIDLHYKACNAVFGLDPDEIVRKIQETNRILGGLTPNVTKAIFTYSEYDPMQSLMVRQDLGPDAIAKMLSKGGYPCAELSLRYDTKEAIELRKFITNTLKSWLAKK